MIVTYHVNYIVGLSYRWISYFYLVDMELILIHCLNYIMLYQVLLWLPWRRIQCWGYQQQQKRSQWHKDPIGIWSFSHKLAKHWLLPVWNSNLFPFVAQTHCRWHGGVFADWKTALQVILGAQAPSNVMWWLALQIFEQYHLNMVLNIRVTEIW